MTAAILLTAAAAWLALATGVAVVIGKAIHTADARCCPHETDVPRLWEAGQ